MPFSFHKLAIPAAKCPTRPLIAVIPVVSLIALVLIALSILGADASYDALGNDAEIVRLRRNISDLQQEKSEMAMAFKPGHPQMKLIDMRIVRARRDLVREPIPQMEKIRGNDIGMVFQKPSLRTRVSLSGNGQRSCSHRKCPSIR